MKLQELREELSQEVKAEYRELRPYVDKISMMLFKQRSGLVKDLKRSKEAKWLGVANTSSVLVDARGKHLRLTFDNSTDSGEFEINSLADLMIEKGSEPEKELRELYQAHEIKSKKKLNYVYNRGKMVVREIHLGKVVDEKTVDFMKDVMKVLASVEDSVENV
jgi:hypothetical protein